MVARRDDRERKPDPGPGLLSTPRILTALAVVLVVALVIGSIVKKEDLEFKEIPPRLIGLWTCSDPVKSDYFVQFRRNFITFGTGGTGQIKCEVIGLNIEEIGDATKYVVHYRDMARTKKVRQILLDPSGEEFRFTDEPKVRWNRFD